MKKVLIVDDNQNNRLLLRALLEDYAEENDQVFAIREAVNGLEASLMAEDEHFHLIFMDIMMPEMDGIEATSRIRSFESKSMIIAISAVDDGDRQRQILSNGAEDYIPKPINADIFTTRLGNYLSLIDARENPKTRFNAGAANLFSSAIYSRKLLFYIQNDDDLAEFWEYFLLNHDDGCERLSGAVRTLFSLGGVAVKLGNKCQVIVEESEILVYMTMTEMDKIDPKIVKLILLKNPDVTDYKILNNKISIQVPKPQLISPPRIEPRVDEVKSAPLQERSVEPMAPLFTPEEISQVSATPYVMAQESVQVYDYMDEEDLDDLKDYVSKLNSLMLIVGGEIEGDEVDEIIAALQKISRVATGYTDSYVIGQSLASMGNTIATHIPQFIEKSNALAPLCAAFGRDLSSWIRLIFVEGASSVNYMDDTIVSNAAMIESFLTMDDAAADDGAGLDDIFDF